MTSAAVLDGIKVVDFSNVRTGAQASQLLADFGAEVVQVEPLGGSPLRAEPAWPVWGRGKRSVELDLHEAADHRVARRLAEAADVVIETFRPGVAERLGLGHEVLAEANPRLIYASVTGFGRRGRFANLQGYEGIVYAATGVPWALDGLSSRSGPAFPAAAYASYPATQLALQGILAALYEREASGVGQRVETSLAQGLSVHDVFGWFSRVVAERFHESFTQVPRVLDGVPTGGLSFRLLVALTKDGEWLQFSQTPEKLFRAMMEMFGLSWMFDNPEWKTAPDFEDPERRVAFWDKLLTVVRSKTAAEWRAEFDRDPNVWGERFSRRAEVLHHPQMLWTNMVTEIEDPVVGKVRQPGALVQLSKTPAGLGCPAPRRGEFDATIRREASETPPAPAGARASGASSGRPLDGVTIVELATFYAAPFGATLLAELGARVIKLEPIEGEPHRTMLPFPELAAIKAMQGKECVALSLSSAEGRAIAHRIIAKADLVLQSFRGDQARRLQLDYETLRALNPDLIYHAGSGYGEDGPYGERPAFAPTIGAAAGLAWRNASALLAKREDPSLDEVKVASLQLSAAVLGVGNSDGLSAVSVGTALLLGLLARRRGLGGQQMRTTMVSSTAHALSEAMVEYEGRPDGLTPDPDLYGLHALYRLYETAEEWVFLACPSQKEWARLTSVLDEGERLNSDPRFASLESRRVNDRALAEELARIFRGRSAGEWEAALRRADVACVAVARGPVEANYLDEGSLGRECGFVTTACHPILDEHPRMTPLVEFSRSSTTAGGADLLGQHTERILREFGYGAVEIAELAERRVIYLG